MKTYRVRLTKIKSNHNNLRTDVIDGVTQELPEEGQFFIMFGKPLVSQANVRSITTTEIKSVQKNENEFVFSTQNSEYRLEVLGEKTLEEFLKE